MKKVVKILMLIIVVAILIFLICFGLKQKDNISVDEMYNLSKDINDYANIHIHEVETLNFWDEYRVIDIYRKDDKEFSKGSGYNIGSLSYLNKETKEYITIVDAEQNIYIDSINTEEKYYYGNDNPLLQKENETVLLKDVEEWRDKYKYKGIEIVNSKECYCFQIKQVTNLQTYWIYKDNGLLAKMEQIADQPDTEEKEILTRLYLYEFDTVTDENVKKPNIEEYENAGYKIENR